MDAPESAHGPQDTCKSTSVEDLEKDASENEHREHTVKNETAMRTNHSSAERTNSTFSKSGRVLPADHTNETKPTKRVTESTTEDPHKPELNKVISSIVDSHLSTDRSTNVPRSAKITESTLAEDTEFNSKTVSVAGTDDFRKAENSRLAPNQGGEKISPGEGNGTKATESANYTRPSKFYKDNTPAESTKDTPSEETPAEGNNEPKDSHDPLKASTKEGSNVLKPERKDDIKSPEAAVTANRKLLKACETGAERLCHERNSLSLPPVDSTRAAEDELESVSEKVEMESSESKNTRDVNASAAEEDRTKESGTLKTVSHSSGSGNETVSEDTKKFHELLESGKNKIFVPSSKSSLITILDTPIGHNSEVISVANNVEILPAYTSTHPNVAIPSSSAHQTIAYPNFSISDTSTYPTSAHPSFTIPVTYAYPNNAHSNFPIPGSYAHPNGTHPNFPIPGPNEQSSLVHCNPNSTLQYVYPSGSTFPQYILPQHNSFGTMQYPQAISNSYVCNGNVQPEFNNGQLLTAITPVQIDYNTFQHSEINQQMSLQNYISTEHTHVATSTNNTQANIPSSNNPPINNTPIERTCSNIVDNKPLLSAGEVAIGNAHSQGAPNATETSAVQIALSSTSDDGASNSFAPHPIASLSVAGATISKALDPTINASSSYCTTISGAKSHQANGDTHDGVDKSLTSNAAATDRSRNSKATNAAPRSTGSTKNATVKAACNNTQANRPVSTHAQISASNIPAAGATNTHRTPNPVDSAPKAQSIAIPLAKTQISSAGKESLNISERKLKNSTTKLKHTNAQAKDVTCNVPANSPICGALSTFSNIKATAETVRSNSPINGAPTTYNDAPDNCPIKGATNITSVDNAAGNVLSPSPTTSTAANGITTSLAETQTGKALTDDIHIKDATTSTAAKDTISTSLNGATSKSAELPVSNAQSKSPPHNTFGGVTNFAGVNSAMNRTQTHSETSFSRNKDVTNTCNASRTSPTINAYVEVAFRNNTVNGKGSRDVRNKGKKTFDKTSGSPTNTNSNATKQAAEGTTNPISTVNSLSESIREKEKNGNRRVDALENGVNEGAAGYALSRDSNTIPKIAAMDKATTSNSLPVAADRDQASTSRTLLETGSQTKTGKKKLKRKAKQRTYEAKTATQDFIQNIEDFNTNLWGPRDKIKAEKVKSAFTTLRKNKERWVTKISDYVPHHRTEVMHGEAEDHMVKIHVALNTNENTWSDTLDTIAILTLELKKTIKMYERNMSDLCKPEQQLSENVLEQIEQFTSEQESDGDATAVSDCPSVVELRIAKSNQNNEDSHIDNTDDTILPFLRIEDKLPKEQAQSKRPHRVRPGTVNDQSDSVLHVTVHPSDLNQRVNISFRESTQIPPHLPTHATRPPVQGATVPRSLNSERYNFTEANRVTEESSSEVSRQNASSIMPLPVHTTREPVSDRENDAVFYLSNENSADRNFNTINANQSSNNLNNAFGLTPNDSFVSNMQLNGCTLTPENTDNDGFADNPRDEICNAPELQNTTNSEPGEMSLHVIRSQNNQTKPRQCATIRLSNLNQTCVVDNNNSERTNDYNQSSHNVINNGEQACLRHNEQNATEIFNTNELNSFQNQEQHHQRNDVAQINANRNPSQREYTCSNSDPLVLKGQDGSYSIDASYFKQLRGNKDIQFYKEVNTWKFKYAPGEDTCNICLKMLNDQLSNTESNQRTAGSTSHRIPAASNVRFSWNLNRPSLNPYQNSTALSTGDQTFTGNMSSAKQVAMIFPQMFNDRYMSGMNSLAILEAEGLLVTLDLRNCSLKTFLICSRHERRKSFWRKDSLILDPQPLAACKLNKSKVAVAKMELKLIIVKCVRGRNPPQIEYELNTQVQYSGLAYVKDNVIACSCYSQGRIDVVTVRDGGIETMTTVNNYSGKPEVLCFLPQRELIIFLARVTDGTTLVGVDKTSKEIMFEKAVDSNLDNYWSIAQHSETILLCCTNTNQIYKYSSGGDRQGEIKFPAHALDRPFGLAFDVKGMLLVANEGVHNKGVPPYTKPDIRAFHIS